MYKRTKDHNNQTGVEPKPCKYFKELEKVLGEKPCLKPVAVASNLKKRPLSVASCNSASSNITSDIDDTEVNERKSEKAKKTRMERELELWARRISEENMRRNEFQSSRILSLRRNVIISSYIECT